MPNFGRLQLAGPFVIENFRAQEMHEHGGVANIMQWAYLELKAALAVYIGNSPDGA